MVIPSVASTTAFVAVVLSVCLMVVLAFRNSGGSDVRLRRTLTIRAIVGLGAVLFLSALLSETGIVRSLAKGPGIVLFLASWNGLAAAVAFSSAGRRIIGHMPVAALIGFQAFRLPLERVLHSFYEQGVIPIQMTYSGENFDIVTGILAILVGLGLWRGVLPQFAAWAFNLIGLGLLIAVVRIAVLSTPTPTRTYMQEPAVQLIFHAPYSWIVSICVAGALLGHLLTFRWLLRR